MITTILGISLAIMAISGLLFIFACIYEALTDSSCNTFETVCALIWFVAILNCAICRLAFLDKLDAEKLEGVKERRAELIERCPLNVGECEIKWLDYHADSLHCEYLVQRHKYE